MSLQNSEVLFPEGLRNAQIFNGIHTLRPLHLKQRGGEF